MGLEIRVGKLFKSNFKKIRMGRIRAGFVKRQAEELLKPNKAQFTAKFDENKKKVSELAEVPTKKLRNLIAGYITNKLKNYVD